MNVSGKILASIIKDRGLSISTLARNSGVPEERLRDVLDDLEELDESEIEDIAAELAVPLHVLFAKNAPAFFTAVDFRTKHPRGSAISKGVLEAISFAETLSHTLATSELDLSTSKLAVQVKTKFTEGDAVELASKWRLYWGLSIEEQLELQDANKIYSSLRSFIEDQGVVVIHRSFKTDEAAGIYAHIDGGPHTIIINTTHSSKARKLFTLGHEFCHFLIREEGTSNPSIIRNKIERFCNKFSAHLLAPDLLIFRALKLFNYQPSADSNFIRLFAKKLGISQEALIRRLVEVNLLQESDYLSWKSRFSGTVPPGDQTDGKGGKNDPLQTKRTTYGNQLLRLLAQARTQGHLDEIDIYRLCGLKPKYQNQLFEA